MKFAVIGFAALTCLLVAGCSSDDDAAAPSATPSKTALADAPTSSTAPSVGNQDDPLCAAALQDIEDASALQSKTSDLTTMLQDPTFLTGGDSSQLNQWGEDMLTLTSATQQFYELGVAQTAGEDINADFVTLDEFVQKYSTLLAQTAADATSNTDFVADIQTLFADEDVTAAASAAPTAAQNVSDYLSDRCGITE